MIVEFCKYGNLSNYLRGKRDDFIVYKVSYKLRVLHFRHSFGYNFTCSVSPMHCQQLCSMSSHLTWCMCAGQSQDGKGVPSGSGYELSELMKRRLESVASTGSSASSGFIEDKSYCESEEEEEGKGQARLTSLHTPPPSVVPPAVPLPSPLNHHPAQERKPPLDCSLAWAWWDTSSSCAAVQSLQQEPVSPHWVWGGNCLFPALTWLLLRSFGFSSDIAHRPCCLLMCYFWFH